jgi:hypothetical protein
VSFFVGYPGYREDRGFDPNPYGWMLRPIEQLADEPGGHVFLIGWYRAAGSGALIAYFPIRRFNEMAAGIAVEPGNSFPLENLPIPRYILDDMPRVEEGERWSLLPVEDDIGQELLKAVQKYLSTTDSSVSLGKAHTVRSKKEKSPAKQAEAIERDAKSKSRVGQAAFRADLLEAYARCPITGCALDPPSRRRTSGSTTKAVSTKSGTASCYGRTSTCCSTVTCCESFRANRRSSCSTSQITGCPDTTST